MNEERIREIVREELLKEAAKKEAALIQAQAEFNESMQKLVYKRGISAYQSSGR